MQLPDPPAVTELPHVTPSVYEASLACLAKAVWYASARAQPTPQHPAALLGSCFHEVMAAAHRGKLPRDRTEACTAAGALFDSHANEMVARAHALLRLKYPSPERLPFYNMQRERAAALAATIAADTRVTATAACVSSDSPRRTETQFRSSDGLVVGRPDHLNGDDGVVVDYKTGGSVESIASTEVTDAEARQLRLYAHLAHDNGTHVTKGVITRGDGSKAELAISEADAESEASAAKAQLDAINAAARSGRNFQDIASPSPQNCSACPCIPFCESFWNAASSSWEEECGMHAEGRIETIDETSLRGLTLLTLSLEVTRGTLDGGPAVVEQLPKEWTVCSGARAPATGDIVRIVHGRRLPSSEQAIIRVDKVMTSLWSTRSQPLEDSADG